jgi:hypothetical protein
MGADIQTSEYLLQVINSTGQLYLSIEKISVSCRNSYKEITGTLVLAMYSLKTIEWVGEMYEHSVALVMDISFR